MSVKKRELDAAYRHGGAAGKSGGLRLSRHFQTDPDSKKIAAEWDRGYRDGLEVALANAVDSARRFIKGAK